MYFHRYSHSRRRGLKYIGNAVLGRHIRTQVWYTFVELALELQGSASSTGIILAHIHSTAQTDQQMLKCGIYGVRRFTPGTRIWPDWPAPLNKGVAPCAM